MNRKLTTLMFAAAVLVCAGCAANRVYLPDGNSGVSKETGSRGIFSEAWSTLKADYLSFYSPTNLTWLAGGFAAGALAVNGDGDEDFREWYAANAAGEDADEVSKLFKYFGEGAITIPVFALVASASFFDNSSGPAGMVGKWGKGCLRSIIVGGPFMLLMQNVTGGHRPDEGSSRWIFLNDENGVSGHAFMGAVPFITAAGMSDSPWLKYPLYFCSTLCAYSRINDDDHYLSQAFLGWWIAWTACGAVDAVEGPGVKILPATGGAGLLFEVRF